MTTSGIELAELFLKFGERFGKRVFDLAGSAASTITSTLKKNFAAYYEHTIKRCSNIRTLISRDVAIPLDTIYVPTLLKWKREDVEEDKFTAEIPKTKTIIVTGSAGSGKTVFMRHLFLVLAHSNMAILPVFVELRGLNILETKNLLSYVYHTVTGPGATILQRQFELAVKEGGIYLMLDGFDEIEPCF